MFIYIHIFSYLDTGRIEAIQTSSISKDSSNGVVTSNDDSTVIDLLQKLDKRIDGLEKEIQLVRVRGQLSLKLYQSKCYSTNVFLFVTFDLHYFGV